MTIITFSHLPRGIEREQINLPIVFTCGDVAGYIAQYASAAFHHRKRLTLRFVQQGLDQKFQGTRRSADVRLILTRVG